MEMVGIPFTIVDWTTVDPTVHPGEAGQALWRTQNFGDIRVRMVEYSPGYVANHWCAKGHVILCLEGSMETELEDGRRFTLNAGESYQVGDGAPRHMSRTDGGAKLFIVD